jgi:uncharacterized protein YecT (DUF1311 family)
MYIFKEINMKLITSFFLYLISIHLPTTSYGATYDPCETQRNTIEINDCASKEFQTIDLQLNTAYQELIKNLKNDDSDKERNQEARKLLITAQRNWVQFRKNDCDGVYKLNEGGTIRTAMYFKCMTGRTQQRIKELEDWGR